MFVIRLGYTFEEHDNNPPEPFEGKRAYGRWLRHGLFQSHLKYYAFIIFLSVLCQLLISLVVKDLSGAGQFK